jgi:hypothetical protein
VFLNSYIGSTYRAIHADDVVADAMAQFFRLPTMLAAIDWVSMASQ